MYKKVNSDLGFVAREKAIKEFWIANHIFQKSMEKPAAAKHKDSALPAGLYYL